MTAKATEGKPPIHSAASAKIFHLVMIKPTYYDDDGYPIQWIRSAIPSNTLAALNGLAEDCRARNVLGEGVDIRLHTFDETNKRVRPQKVIDMIRRDGGKALIALVGVQSNQYPRAMDIAKPYREAGLQVAVGGFHISGCISMLSEMPPEMVKAQEDGITFFAGEAEEGRLDQVFLDAWNESLPPLYNFMKDLPSLQDQPAPILPEKHIRRTYGSHSSFDLGRGCPFQCSFCTIINVQGRKSRFRSADDLEKVIRVNYAQKIDRFFITDDNFARNKDWESFFDRLIQLREVDKMDVKFVIQVDTLCHKIPNFIEKAARAGVNRVFIGLENINPDNLLAAKKRQNKITEYRDMIQMWRDNGATTYAGYILGFPNDTKELILQDVETLKRELPLDLVEFFFLTPLPGSEDHKTLLSKNIWMDPDLNKYDLDHRVSHHPKMSDTEWEEAYEAAWASYYSFEHIETVLKRAAAHPRGRPGNKLILLLYFHFMVTYEGIHPLEGGFLRVKHRRDRRSGLPIENPFIFYPKYVWELLRKHWTYGTLAWKFYRIYKNVKKNPDRRSFRDLATNPDTEEDLDSLEMFTGTRGGEAAVAKTRRQKEIIAAAREAAE